MSTSTTALLLWKPHKKSVEAFSPDSIAGLQLWLKADAGTYTDDAKTTPATADTDVIGCWADQSTNGIDATQATAGKKPTLKLNIQNSKPVIRFAAASDNGLAHSNVALTDLTIYIAYAKGADVGAYDFILGGNSCGVWGGGASATGYGIYDGTRIRQADHEPNVFGIACFQNAKLFYNGAEEIVYGGAQTTTGFTLTRVGTRSDNTTQDFTGDIGEILVYNTVHDDTTRHKIEAYLGSRWGITVYTGVDTGAYIHSGPGVILTIDDGRRNVFPGFRYMQARGMRATDYIITDLIGDDAPTPVLTADQLEIMDAAFWDVANHTSDHTLLTTLSEANQEIKISGGKSDLDALGLIDASMHVAYPYGGFNADTLTAMAATGMLSGRTTVDDPALDPATVAKLQIGLSLSIADSTTLGDIQAIVNAAIAANQYALLLVHGLHWSNPAVDEMSMATFMSMIDWIYTNNIPMLTISDFYALLP